MSIRSIDLYLNHLADRATAGAGPAKCLPSKAFDYLIDEGAAESNPCAYIPNACRAPCRKVKRAGGYRL